MPARAASKAIFAVVCLSAFLPATSAVAAPTERPVRAVAASEPIAEAVAEASFQFGLPEAWIRAVIWVESAGDPKAVSPAGAMGLMQIMPQTFADLRAELGLGADAFAVHDNILAGTRYLRTLYDRYGSPGFLVAYNAGPARWEDHLAVARPLPPETLNYLAKLTPLLALERADLPSARPASPRGSPLFVALDGAFTATRNGEGSPANHSARRLGGAAGPSAAPFVSAGRASDFAPARSALFAPTSMSARAP